MSKLEKPSEVVVGNNYFIHEGFGEGKTGLCVGARESDFGHLWALIKTDDDGEDFWVRWQMLSHVEG